MELVFVRSYLWWAPCVHGASRAEPEVGNSFCGRCALYPPVSRRGGSRQAGDGGFFANGVWLEADGEEGEQEEEERGRWLDTLSSQRSWPNVYCTPPPVVLLG